MRRLLTGWVLGVVLAGWPIAAMPAAGAEFRDEDRQVGDARLRGEALVGRPVIAADGRPLGEVRRVIVDPGGYLITLGVRIGEDDELVAVPASQARLSGTVVVVDVAPSEIAGLPPFDPAMPRIAPEDESPDQSAR